RGRRGGRRAHRRGSSPREVEQAPTVLGASVARLGEPGEADERESRPALEVAGDGAVAIEEPGDRRLGRLDGAPAQARVAAEVGDEVPDVECRRGERGVVEVDP